MGYLISIDTGGTFTDLIAIPDQGSPIILKVPSTPQNPEEAIIDGLKKIGIIADEIIHGTTVAINAVLQRKGAKVALITTKGFKDVIEIGRQNRRDIYELVGSRTEPLVPPELRYEVEERINCDSNAEKELSEKSIKQLIGELDLEKITSVAICFLFSFLNDRHEKMIFKALSKHFKERNIDIPISVSSFVHPEYREYERTSTTVMDAYIKPLISNYIKKLDQAIIQGGFTSKLAIMKSSKGLSVPSGLIRKPIEILVSGLAGGVQAGELTSRLTGLKDIITLDIGGTSTDVAQVTNGVVAENYSFDVDGLPISSTSVDVVTIGAGGGSIAKITGGLLRVGPDSAGADPGPASYDMGGSEVTVTDADLTYGVLPDNLGGGVLQLHRHKSEEVLNALSEKLGSSLDRTITGVRQIFHENIAGALRKVSTERGVDPRKYALLAFGGAGPVHGVELAEILGITHVIIPPYPGIWSAFGLLGADYRYDMSRGLIKDLELVGVEAINSHFEELKTQIKSQAVSDGIAEISKDKIINLVAMRYIGQSSELAIPWDNDINILRGSFIKKHRKEYGFASDDEPIELVALRTTLTIAHPDPELENINTKGEPEIIGYRNVLKIGKVPVYNRDDLGSDFSREGPLIIDQDDCTTWIPPQWGITVDILGFIHVRFVNND